MDLAFFTPEAAVALVTLTVLEIVLGIDNVIFIAILAGKLPPEQQKKARTIGLLLAMVQRILFLMLIGWILHLDKTVLFELPDGLVQALVPDESTEEAIAKASAFTVKDVIIALGGVFLLFKAVREIHDKLEGPEPKASTARRSACC